MTSPNNQPVFILVNPQLAENIGMAARAMLNCGVYEMRLVAPKESHLSDKAFSASSGADIILQNAKIYNTTTEAIADCDYIYATTARRRGMIKPVCTARFAAQKICEHPHRYGILFGPERTGLHNDDVCLSNEIIEIPLNPEHCSLNLSQAVLLVGYEWYQQHIQAPEEHFELGKTTFANKEKTLLFLQALEQKLEPSGIFKQEEKRRRMTINLRNIFTRADITEQELNTLYGVINHLNLPTNQQND